MESAAFFFFRLRLKSSDEASSAMVSSSTMHERMSLTSAGSGVSPSNLSVSTVLAPSSSPGYFLTLSAISRSRTILRSSRIERVPPLTALFNDRLTSLIPLKDREPLEKMSFKASSVSDCASSTRLILSQGLRASDLAFAPSL